MSDNDRADTSALRVLRGPVEGADCANCPMAVDGKPPHEPVRGIGPDDPDWILIGEGPGRQEVSRGMGFVGPSGDLINRALRETGIDRARVWVSHAVLCLPQGSAKDEKARHEAATACRGRLMSELAMFPGRPVLAAGNVAAKALVGHLTKLKITDITGAHFESDVGDGTGVRDVIPTVHPAAILRGTDGDRNDRGKGDKGTEKTGSHVASIAFWSVKWDILKVKSIARWLDNPRTEANPEGAPDIRLPLRMGEEIDTEITAAPRARALVRRVLADAAQTKRIAIDYETYVDDPERNSALQAFIAKIKLIGLASAGRSVCVAWSLLDPATINAYRRVLADPTITKEWHNGEIYDVAVSQNMWHRFVVAGPSEDTLLGQHAAWPGAKKKLQHVISQYRAVPPWKSEYRNLDEDSLGAEAAYCASDALATHYAVKPTLFWIKKNAVEKVYEVDKVKAAFARLMHEKGYYVCPDVNAEIGRRLTAAIDTATSAMHARYTEPAMWDAVIGKLAAEQAKTQRKGDPVDYPGRVAARRLELDKLIAKEKFVFDPANANHAVAFLKAAGVPLWKPTKSGKKTSTSGDVLEEFGDHPEVASMLLLRSNQQLYKTFIVRMFNWVQDSQGAWQPPYVQDDGRVHPLWSPTQISGRFSSKDPPSSNWSMGEETHLDPIKRLPNTRRQLIAPPGHGIVAFDAAQLEARTMAVQSGDPFLCDIFATGKDIHFEAAKLIFPHIANLDPTDPEYGDLRDLTKRLEYGAWYEGSITAIQRALASAKPELAGARGYQMIEKAVMQLKAATPGLTAWKQRLLAQTSLPPYTLRSYLLGRMRVFPLGDPPPTDVANNPNQFMGDDVISLGITRFMPRLDRYKGTAFPILHQHDAVYVQCREDDMLSVARDIAETFPMTVKAVNGAEIDFPIDLKMGFSYHVEPSDKMKVQYPQLVWPVGRPGLKKVKL